jgi:Uma2 family endonuclease
MTTHVPHPLVTGVPSPAANSPALDNGDLPIIAEDMPVMYEDEGQDEMGESQPHTQADQILSAAIATHLKGQYAVYSNLNVYYHKVDRWAYVSPDIMAVKPTDALPQTIASYRIGANGPAPVLIIEILWRRSFQQQDLTNKPDIYARLGVAEYILVDSTGELLPQRLLLKRLQDDGTWLDAQDPDGGVTSRLGFRIVLENDDRPRLIETRTGKRYVRPDEAEAEAEARRLAEAGLQAEAESRRLAELRLRQLEEELSRLRGQTPGKPAS